MCVCGGGGGDDYGNKKSGCKKITHKNKCVGKIHLPSYY